MTDPRERILAILSEVPVIDEEGYESSGYLERFALERAVTEILAIVDELASERSGDA